MRRGGGEPVQPRLDSPPAPGILPLEDQRYGAVVRARFRLALAALCAAVIPALCLAEDSAQDSGMPQRKPGWWELNLTVEGPTPQPVHQTVRMCTDAAVDQVQTPVGIHPGKTCPPIAISHDSDAWTFSETCVMGKTTVATEGRAKGDFSASYHVDLKTRLSPPPLPQMGEIRTAIDAKWLGACPADKKPGDVEATVTANVAPQGQ